MKINIIIFINQLTSIVKYAISGIGEHLNHIEDFLIVNRRFLTHIGEHVLRKGMFYDA